MAIYDKHFDGYRVFVGDLARQATRYDVEGEFGRYGKLVDVWVARNPPGFAFLVFKNADDCERAVRRCHGRRVCGRRIRVEFARPFDDRSGGSNKRHSPPSYSTHSRYRSRSVSRSRSPTPRRDRSRRHRSHRSYRSRSRSQSRSHRNHIRRDHTSRRGYSRSYSRSASRSVSPVAASATPSKEPQSNPSGSEYTELPPRVTLVNSEGIPNSLDPPTQPQ